MIDTHAHIDTEQFDNDRQEMLQRAFDNGIEYIIIPAIEQNGFDFLPILGQVTFNKALIICQTPKLL